MVTVIVVIHLLLALALVGAILLQRSEGGALGIGGGGGGIMSGRAVGTLLTRTTAILAASFMITSLVLAILANNANGPRKSLLDKAVPAGPSVPVGSDKTPVSGDKVEVPTASKITPASTSDVPSIPTPLVGTAKSSDVEKQ